MKTCKNLVKTTFNSIARLNKPLLISGLIVSSLALQSCGGGSSSTPAPPTPKKITLTFNATFAEGKSSHEIVIVGCNNTRKVLNITLHHLSATFPYTANQKCDLFTVQMHGMKGEGLTNINISHDGSILSTAVEIEKGINKGEWPGFYETVKVNPATQKELTFTESPTQKINVKNNSSTDISTDASSTCFADSKKLTSSETTLTLETPTCKGGFISSKSAAQEVCSIDFVGGSPKGSSGDCLPKVAKNEVKWNWTPGTHLLEFTGGTTPSTGKLLTGINLTMNESGEGWGIFSSVTLKNNMDKLQNKFDEFNKKGMHLIRLPFRADYLYHSGKTASNIGQPDSTYLTNLVKQIKYLLTDKQNIVILDNHDYGRWGPSVGASGGDWGTVINDKEMKAVWSNIVNDLSASDQLGTNMIKGKQYLYNDRLWLELANEPNNSGSLNQHITATNVMNVMKDGIAGIRSANVNNKVILDGTSWSGLWSWTKQMIHNQYGNSRAFTKTSITDNNIAYDMHQYFDANNSGGFGGYGGPTNTNMSTYQYCDSQTIDINELVQWMHTNGAQVIVGEFGWPSSDWIEYKDKHICIKWDASKKCTASKQLEPGQIKAHEKDCQTDANNFMDLITNSKNVDTVDNGSSASAKGGFIGWTYWSTSSEAGTDADGPQTLGYTDPTGIRHATGGHNSSQMDILNQYLSTDSK